MKSREVCTKHEWNPWTRDPYQPKIPCLPKIPVIPRSQSIQDPSHPKIPVNPRSQSAQDPSQHWMPSCLFGIWLMWNSHQLNFSSIYYIIWQKCIFPSLKKWMRQGPAIFLFSNFFQFHYCLCSRYILVLMHTYCTLRSIWELQYSNYFLAIFRHQSPKWGCCHS